MTAKFLLTLLVVFMTMVATACMPAITDKPDSGFSAVPPANDPPSLPAIPVPVTGKAATDVTRNVQTFPELKLHSKCMSANSLRQEFCTEPEPAGPGLSSVIRNRDAGSEQNAHSYPGSKVHSACSSKIILRQDKCVE